MGDRVNYVLQVYRNYAAFTGRARRLEYWSFTAFFGIVLLLAAVLVKIGEGDHGSAIEMAGAILLSVFVIGSIVPSLAVRVRRLHDINRTGYWILVTFIPVIGGLILLVFSLTPGTKGMNRFGQDPKGSTDEISQLFS